MAESEEENQRAKTTRLVRSIAREIANEVIEEHLEDYEHKPKKPDQTELEV